MNKINLISKTTTRITAKVTLHCQLKKVFSLSCHFILARNLNSPKIWKYQI